MSGHIVEVRRTYAVCLTCGQVSSCRSAIEHVIETFLHMHHRSDAQASAARHGVSPCPTSERTTS